MDIVVTIPKSEYENDTKETTVYKRGGYEQFWALSKMPKKLKVRDRVWFVKNKKIDSSMIVSRISEGEQKCEVTGRVWTGRCILFLTDLNEYSSVIDGNGNEVKVRGFQGFRYKWW